MGPTASRLSRPPPPPPPSPPLEALKFKTQNPKIEKRVGPEPGSTLRRLQGSSAKLPRQLSCEFWVSHVDFTLRTWARHARPQRAHALARRRRDARLRTYEGALAFADILHINQSGVGTMAEGPRLRSPSRAPRRCGGGKDLSIYSRAYNYPYNPPFK